jgi:hypothetical protein
VPTATFRILFVFVVLSHERRRVLHFNVTEHPTEEWTAQQIREALGPQKILLSNLLGTRTISTPVPIIVRLRMAAELRARTLSASTSTA